MPLVTQWNDAKGVSFCNGSSIDTVKDCNNNLCLCTHTLEIEIGQVGSHNKGMIFLTIELSLNNK